MTPRARWIAIGLAATAAACSDIAAPLRDDVYEWRLFLPAAQGSGTDTISFHWPSSALPVSVWVEDTASLPANVTRAIAVWKSVYLYREFDAEVIGDSSVADVIVRSGPSTPKLDLRMTRLHSAFRSECSGETDVIISPDHTQLTLPVRVFIDPHGDPTLPGLEECLQLTTLHEFGHALGIFAHSPNPTDLMFADPQVTEPSQLDRETAELIYHVRPTVAPAR